MSKFIIALDVGSREQRNAVTTMIQAKGWQLWHWMEDLWLISGVPEHITSQAIDAEMEGNPIIGTKQRVVMQIADNAPQTHWGRCNQEAWEWMRHFWGSPN